MDLPEFAGLLFHPSTTFRNVRLAAAGRREALAELRRQIQDRHLSHFLVRGPVSGRDLTARDAAEWLNAIQDLGASSRLGLPVTFSSDPRHGPSSQVGIRSSSGHLSQWPEPIGLGAVGDLDLVRDFTAAVRREYRAMGIHVALHPQADLASDPRWMRISGTFGQDPHSVAAMVAAYVEGMQGAALGPDSVACMVKHFPGGGPQKDGEDPHFDYGKEQIYPNGRFEDHVLPFRAAVAAGCAQVMPYYGLPRGVEGIEEMGFGFNRAVVTRLLREELGFDGLVCTDWGIITDHVFQGDPMPAIAWGLEDASPRERLRRAVEAGVDQLGGEDCVELLVDLVEQKEISADRILESARRVLRQKFLLGLFDQPMTDPVEAAGIVGNPDLRAAGLRAHQRSVTLVANRAVAPGDRPLLPLPANSPVRVVGMDRAEVAEHAVVAEHADVTLLALETPYEPRPRGFQRVHRAGRLDLTEEERAALLPHVGPRTVVLLRLDRPAVVPEVIAAAGAVLVEWGGPLSTILDVVFGRCIPEGRLPFDLPSSMAAVEAHSPDLAGGSADPTFRAGHQGDLTPWRSSVND